MSLIAIYFEDPWIDFCSYTNAHLLNKNLARAILNSPKSKFYLFISKHIASSF